MDLAVDVAPAVLWGFYSDQDWQRSLNGLAAYDALDKLIGTAQTATCPQISWAWGYNADGSPKYQPFYAPRLAADLQRGRVPQMTWMSMNGADRSNPSQIAAFNNEATLAGKHDVYLKQFAADAAAYGHRFVLRLNPEFNGWWEGPFSEYDSNGKLANGNTDGSFARAWQYVVNMVRPIAPNILWYWCANPLSSSSGNPTFTGKLPHFYPGDGFVDFVGYDVYNKASDDGSPWLMFHECMEGRPSGWPVNSVAPMLALAPGKPWILGEVGCALATAGDTTPGAGDRAAWIKDMLDTIRTRYPCIRMLTWYNVAPYALDAAAAVGWTQGTANDSFPGAPLPDPESVLYRVVAPDPRLAAANAQATSLASQLTAVQAALSGDQAQIAADLAQAGTLAVQVKTLQGELAAAQTKLASYAAASAQMTGGIDALRALETSP